MAANAECYGRMFPSLLEKVPNQAVRGRVFGYHVVRSGLAEIACTPTVDRASWKECTGCADFDDCYRLSVATTLLHLALRDA
jgi:hypothetical protein